jgi:hypothetical protein
MPAANTPFYFDWTFWAVVVAAIAVVLSQLPPVHRWFRGARIDLEAYSRILITHKVGNPNLQLHLILNNVGGRSVRVKNISINVDRDGKKIADLPSQNYFQNPGDANTVLFTSFSLKPSEEWAHVVNFLNFFNREDEKKYRTAESKSKEYALEKRRLPENKDTVIEIPSEIITPFAEMFKEKFVWHPGEYKIAISVNTTRVSTNITKRYIFTLFESDSAELSKVKDDYKYGDGIFWNSEKYPGVIAQITGA